MGRGGCGNNFAGRLSQEGAGEYRLALLGSLPSHHDSSPLSHLRARWWPYNPPQHRSAERSGVDLRPMLVVQLSLRCVVSVGGYLATVSGRTTCAPCKADWPSMASVLTSLASWLSATVRWSGLANVLTKGLHACGQLQCGLAKSRFNL